MKIIKTYKLDYDTQNVDCDYTRYGVTVETLVEYALGREARFNR